MALDTQTFTETLVIEHCCNCGVAFGMPKTWHQHFKDTGQYFYCPAGHSQHYTETAEQKLKRELANVKENLKWQKESRERAERDVKHYKASAAAQKGQVTKLKNRTARGLCPCCDQYFPSLDKHMADKHPEFEQTEELG